MEGNFVLVVVLIICFIITISYDIYIYNMNYVLSPNQATQVTLFGQYKYCSTKYPNNCIIGLANPNIINLICTMIFLISAFVIILHVFFDITIFDGFFNFTNYLSNYETIITSARRY